ncbi:MAG: MipA/OmpV family protein [Candidatus Adiutrix sp.]|nr:MipA/OmpV family protein [Candidatus Adiutrix sp.]
MNKASLTLKKNALLTAAFLFWAVLGPSPALWAQSDEELAGQNAVLDNARGENWRVSLGLGLMSAPEFEGSDKNEAKFVPVIDVRYGRFFLSGAQGLGFEAVSTRDWTLAPSLKYRQGRDQDDSDLLRGLGDVDGGAELGAVLSWHPSDLAFFLGAYHGLGRARGLTAELGALYSTPLSEKLRATLGASLMLADSDYNQAYFGISREQSLRSGYRAYEADGGLKHVAVSASLAYELAYDLNLGFFAEYKRLVGPAADSPLVERGSEKQFSGGLSLGFKFGQ